MVAPAMASNGPPSFDLPAQAVADAAADELLAPWAARGVDIVAQPWVSRCSITRTPLMTPLASTPPACGWRRRQPLAATDSTTQPLNWPPRQARLRDGGRAQAQQRGVGLAQRHAVASTSLSKLPAGNTCASVARRLASA